MKSLAARKAAREKQRQEEQKAREDGGLPKEQQAEQGGGSVAANQSDDPNALDPHQPVPDDDGDDDDDDGDEDEEPMNAEDAEVWVDDSVENIKANLSDLSDADLTAIDEAEKRGKARVSVADAIQKERDARKSKTAEWQAGKGGQ